MKKTALIAALLLVVLGPGRASSGQSDWESYTSRSIRDVIGANSGEATKGADYVISGDLFTSKSDVIFGGEHRPVSDAKKKFVRLWFETRDLPPESVDKVTEEYLFSQDGVDYWLPVVAQLRPFIEKELKKGDKIRLYFFFVGGYDGKRKIDWVLAVEEFRKL